MAYGVINWDTWLVFTDGDVRCEGVPIVTMSSIAAAGASR